ncbi:hypothetical protein BGZ83_004602 [Gryganskiella cystojenkinii]|nr:hypothetical protein BGZ83_004602 [Gryganskiella cystojenkinii]
MPHRLLENSGEGVVPSDMMYEVEKDSKITAQSVTVAAAAKAGSFFGKKSTEVKEAKAAGYGVGMARISFADLGFSVEKLRPIF